MSRRSKPQKRIPLPDPMYNSVDIAKFINRLMKKGKKQKVLQIKDLILQIDQTIHINL